MAADLFNSAKVLLPHIDTESDKTPRPFTDVFMMLCSYAIENLFKGLIITQEKDEIQKKLENGTQFGEIISEGHRLDKLAIRANCLDIEGTYGGLLKRLTRSATWFARYPAPLFPSGYENENFFGLPSSSFIPQGAYSSRDITDVEKILQQLYIRINENEANQRIHSIADSARSE